jgi:hypothetical protein
MRSFKWVAIILSSVIALIASLLIVVSLSMRPPRESKITTDFRAHRGEYEQLRKMLLDDKDVDVIADWGVLTNDSPISRTPPDGMPIKRYQEYLALLKDTGARAVAQMREPPEARILIWGSGWGADTRHVAVSWLASEPPNTMASLEAFYRTPKPRNPVYIHIDGNWYIWADW